MQPALASTSCLQVQYALRCCGLAHLAQSICMSCVAVLVLTPASLQAKC